MPASGAGAGASGSGKRDASEISGAKRVVILTDEDVACKPPPLISAGSSSAGGGGAGSTAPQDPDYTYDSLQAAVLDGFVTRKLDPNSPVGRIFLAMALCVADPAQAAHQGVPGKSGYNWYAVSQPITGPDGKPVSPACRVVKEVLAELNSLWAQALGGKLPGPVWIKMAMGILARFLAHADGPADTLDDFTCRSVVQIEVLEEELPADSAQRKECGLVFTIKHDRGQHRVEVKLPSLILMSHGPAAAGRRTANVDGMDVQILHATFDGAAKKAMISFVLTCTLKRQLSAAAVMDLVWGMLEFWAEKNVDQMEGAVTANRATRPAEPGLARVPQGADYLVMSGVDDFMPAVQAGQGASDLSVLKSFRGHFGGLRGGPSLWRDTEAALAAQEAGTALSERDLGLLARWRTIRSAEGHAVNKTASISRALEEGLQPSKEDMNWLANQLANLQAANETAHTDALKRKGGSSVWVPGCVVLQCVKGRCRFVYVVNRDLWWRLSHNKWGTCQCLVDGSHSYHMYEEVTALTVEQFLLAAMDGRQPSPIRLTLVSMKGHSTLVDRAWPSKHALLEAYENACETVGVRSVGAIAFWKRAWDTLRTAMKNSQFNARGEYNILGDLEGYIGTDSGKKAGVGRTLPAWKIEKIEELA